MRFGSAPYSTAWSATKCTAALRSSLPAGPRVLRREPVFDVDADHAVARREQHDVVVEGAAGRALAAADHATAVYKHQHRPARGAALGSENIDYVARITAVFHVAQDLDAGVGLLLLQRRVEQCRF